MFTGLVAAIGAVVHATPVGAELDLAVDLAPLDRSVAVGDSIALSGTCCTVTATDSWIATFRLSEETLRRTWLGRAAPGTSLNLEPALRAGDPLGGHIVQGHVDGLATVLTAVDPTVGGTLRVRLPTALARYAVEKGSIALDGVSLTIAALRANDIDIALIPHTARVTTLGTATPGQPLNVEVDILAKYVERLVGDRGG